MVDRTTTTRARALSATVTETVTDHESGRAGAASASARQPLRAVAHAAERPTVIRQTLEPSISGAQLVPVFEIRATPLGRRDMRRDVHGHVFDRAVLHRSRRRSGAPVEPPGLREPRTPAAGIKSSVSTLYGDPVPSAPAAQRAPKGGNRVRRSTSSSPECRRDVAGDRTVVGGCHFDARRLLLTRPAVSRGPSPAAREPLANLRWSAAVRPSSPTELGGRRVRVMEGRSLEYLENGSTDARVRSPTNAAWSGASLRQSADPRDGSKEDRSTQPSRMRGWKVLISMGRHRPFASSSGDLLRRRRTAAPAHRSARRRLGTTGRSDSVADPDAQLSHGQ